VAFRGVQKFVWVLGRSGLPGAVARATGDASGKTNKMHLAYIRALYVRCSNVLRVRQARMKTVPRLGRINLIVGNVIVEIRRFFG